MTRWNERFLASTRGQIVTLLRRSSRTVGELAAAVGLTPNGVRAHLAGLERDGLVEQEGVRRAIGKPAGVYRLSEEAESLFPKAYAFLALELMAELRARGEGDLGEVLRSMGRRAGRESGVAGGDAMERLGGALAVLASLGADAEVEAVEGGAGVRSHGCPLSSVVAEEPAACGVLEGFLEGAVGVKVTQTCEHGAHPRCRFVVAAGPPES